MNDIAQIWWIELIKALPSLIVSLLAAYFIIKYPRELWSLFRRINKFKGFGIEAEFASESLDNAISAHALTVGQDDRQSALKRLDFIAPLLKDTRILWIDDNHANNRYERALLERFGIHFTLASSSAQAETALRENVFLLVITDSQREGRATEGLDFVKRMVEERIYRWTIAYVGSDQDGLPRPPYLFGITNRPDQLIHLVCDIVERERI
ncbi:hypothetical protein MTYM_01557 [Methylococcales bacterium]|nr:hypothetical protein MTYM_01557 [Methylococcales bacterium]